MGKFGLWASTALAGATLNSCGTGRAPLPDEQNPTFRFTDDPSSEAANLLWDDGDCMAGEKPPSSPSSAPLIRWRDGNPDTYRANLDGIISAQGFFDESKMRGQVSARDLYNRTCMKPASNGRCLDQAGRDLGWKVKSPGKAPRFCRSNGDYPRDSLERVSLSSAVAFKQGSDFLRATILKVKGLEGVDLKIVPTFETLWPPESSSQDSLGRRSVIVRNVSYFPPGKSKLTPFIAVFPRKFGDQEDFPRFWESRFVIAHELGHHAEHVLGLDHFEEVRSLTRFAVSEAFADLVGFAAIGLNDAELTSMPCMANRSPAKESFSDGVAKIIDRALMDALKLKTVSTMFEYDGVIHGQQFTASTCPLPSRTKPHDLGAVLAHSFYDLVNTTFEITAVPSDERAALFAVTAREWFQIIENAVGQGADAAGDLVAVAKGLEQTIQELFVRRGVQVETNIAKVLCQRMNLHFSGTRHTDWFNQKDTCSKP